MSKVAVAVVSVLVLARLCPALPRPGGAAGDAAKVFTGEVMDDMCAKSHRDAKDDEEYGQRRQDLHGGVCEVGREVRSL